jgi:hypothetical protein
MPTRLAYVFATKSDKVSSLVGPEFANLTKAKSGGYVPHLTERPGRERKTVSLFENGFRFAETCASTPVRRNRKQAHSGHGGNECRLSHGSPRRGGEA